MGHLPRPDVFPVGERLFFTTGGVGKVVVVAVVVVVIYVSFVVAVLHHVPGAGHRFWREHAGPLATRCSFSRLGVEAGRCRDGPVTPEAWHCARAGTLPLCRSRQVVPGTQDITSNVLCRPGSLGVSRAGSVPAAVAEVLFGAVGHAFS